VQNELSNGKFIKFLHLCASLRITAQIYEITSPLENIRVASSCAQDWNEMTGDERARFCGACKLNVYNLSGMSRREAENLIFQSEEGRLCVRFYRRADGSILTKDCPVGWRAIRRNISKTAAAFASLVFTALSAIGLTNFFAKPNRATMGAIRISENSNVPAKEKPFAAMGNFAIEQKGEVEYSVGELVEIHETPQKVQKKTKRKLIQR